MSEFAVEMVEIAKEFGAVRALRGVTVRVRAGTVHGLVGGNGAGKSTLMKILDGVYPAGTFAGEVRLRGRRVAFASPGEARRQGIGAVPQEVRVVESLGVAENIFVGQVGRGGGWWVSPGELRERAGRLLADLGIDLDPGAPAGSLGTSQKQLVMIARALAARPAILILDEATACLTGRESDVLFGLVRRLRDQGQTVVFVSHRLREVEEVADRVTVLRDGAVAAEFDRGAYTREDLVSAMLGRAAEEVAGEGAGPIGAEVLRVEGLTVPHPHLAGRDVVSGVSFTVGRGEVLGLAGLMGSGRSEVLNALSGRLPYRGRVFVDGREVKVRRAWEAHRAGIGLLTEDRQREGLLPNLAVRENITVGALGRVARAGFVSRRREDEAAEGWRRDLGIKAPDVGTPVTALSGGNQQKVILARLLQAGPRVLLLDEPTQGVDVGARAEIYGILRRLARQGLATVLVSSEWPELLGLCDRILVLSRGRVVEEMGRAEADEGRILRAATGGGA